LLLLGKRQRASARELAHFDRPDARKTFATVDEYSPKPKTNVLDGNPAYDALPVPLPVFKAAIAAYTASNAAALDGSKKAIEDRKKKRADLTVLLRLLGHYVEGACKGDMTAFLSSGFEPATRTMPSAPQPLPQPTVDKVDQGITGELLVILKPAPKARIHELEYTVFDGGTPGAWTTITVARANKTIPINGLTPGKTYAFRFALSAHSVTPTGANQ